MKIVALLLAALVILPMAAYIVMRVPRYRGVLFSLAIFAPTLGTPASVNIWSMEHYRGPDRGFEVTLADLLVWGITIGLLAGHRNRIKLVPFNTVPMLLFFVVAWISSTGAPQFLLAAFALYKYWRMYWVYWCVYNGMRIGLDRRHIWIGLLLVGLYMTYTCLRQKYLQGLYRVHGPFDHSNGIPMFVHMYMAPLLLWGLCDRRLSERMAVVTIFAAMGSVFAVVATQSRVGLLLSGVSVVLVLFLANIYTKSSLRVRISSIVVLLGIVVGGAMAADTIIDRFVNAPESSGEARDEFNYAAELMARDRPFGVGVNCFPHVMTYSDEYSGHVEVMAGEEHAGVCHHIYWLMASEIGFGGLVVFLLVIGRFTARGLFWSFPARSVEAMLLPPFMLGATCLWLTGLYEWGMRLTPQSYMYMITSALLVGFAERAREQRRLVAEARRCRVRVPVFA